MINGLSKSSSCDELGCTYFKVIYQLQSFSNGMFHSCKISTDSASRGTFAMTDLLVIRTVLLCCVGHLCKHMLIHTCIWAVLSVVLVGLTLGLAFCVFALPRLFFHVFLPVRCYASLDVSYISVCVCLSYCVEMGKRRIIQIMLHDNPRTISFHFWDTKHLIKMWIATNGSVVYSFKFYENRLGSGWGQLPLSLKAKSKGLDQT